MITMLTALLHVHAADPFGKKELPLMYLLFFFGFLILGAGKYSVDHLIGGKSKRR
jgi:putative oxidoreductase